MPEKYIQLFNAAEQPFFVGMDSGKASWLIDEGKIHLLIHAAHPADDGKYYYEDLRTQAVSWSLPLTEMTASAANTAKVLMTFNEVESEEWIGDSFPADESALLTIAIDAFLLGEGGDYDEDSVETEEDVSVHASEKVAVAVSPTNPPKDNVMNAIFSAKSSEILSTEPAKAQKEQSGTGANGTTIARAQSALDDSDSGSDAGSESSAGGTASSDDEEPVKASAPAVPNVDMSILTNDLILSQNTVKVRLNSPLLVISYTILLVCTFLISVKQDDGASQRHISQLERTLHIFANSSHRVLRRSYKYYQGRSGTADQQYHHHEAY